MPQIGALAPVNDIITHLYYLTIDFLPPKVVDVVRRSPLRVILYRVHPVPTRGQGKQNACAVKVVSRIHPLQQRREECEVERFYYEYPIQVSDKSEKDS